MKILHRRLLTLLVLVSLVLGVCLSLPYLFWLFVPWPMDYVVEAEFTELPSDDKELERWLLDQPDVYIGRVGRKDKTLFMIWGHYSNRPWDPVTPDVRQVFDKFGYKGLTNYSEEKSFRDR